jgi:hypothetical protein
MKVYRPPTQEALLTKSIRQLLNSVGVFHYKAWGGPMSAPGVPDIIGCFKGRFIGIEVKSQKGVVSEYQKHFLQRIIDAGGIAIIARSLDDVIEGLGLQDRFLKYGG